MVIRDLYKIGAERLKKANTESIENPNSEARAILEALLKIGFGTLGLYGEKEADEALLREYLSKIALRSRNIPLSYITRKKEFFGLDFYVKEGVLIPRPETENLVSAVLEFAASFNGKNMRIADLCCGSGCIGITLALKAGCGVDMYDISDTTVEVTRINIEKLGAKNVKIIKKDILSEKLDTEKDGGAKYDVIVSNPPYIPVSDIAGLMPDVRDYEPKNALTDGGDGFAFYRRIAELSEEYLRENGITAVEVGLGAHTEVKRIFEEKFPGKKARVITDYFGIERVVVI